LEKWLQARTVVWVGCRFDLSPLYGIQ